MSAPAKIEAGLLNALAVALPELGAAKKNSNNPHFKSKYADLGAVIEAIRPVTEHGIWWRQVSHEADNGVSVETYYIGHGEELSAGKVFVPADRSNAQGYGSAQTYARRYGLLTAFGLPTEDDDGNAASAAPRTVGRQSQGGAVSSPRSATLEADITKIIQLCEAVGGNQAQLICEAYNVSAITELNARQAAGVITRLTEKLGEKEEA